MSYIVFKHNTEYVERVGLEGPFHYPSGRVLYYDTTEGKYWDPRTDFYVEADEINALNQQIVELLQK